MQAHLSPREAGPIRCFSDLRYPLTDSPGGLLTTEKVPIMVSDQILEEGGESRIENREGDWQVTLCVRSSATRSAAALAFAPLSKPLSLSCPPLCHTLTLSLFHSLALSPSLSFPRSLAGTPGAGGCGREAGALLGVVKPRAFCFVSFSSTGAFLGPLVSGPTPLPVNPRNLLLTLCLKPRTPEP